MGWECNLEAWAEQVSAIYCTSSRGIWLQELHSFNWNEGLRVHFADADAKCTGTDVAETVHS